MVMENSKGKKHFLWGHWWRRGGGSFHPYKGLVTNYGEGGATKREGGASEVLPV